MIIRKRNGSEVTFNKNNIIESISKANEKVRIEDRLTIQEIKDIAKDIEQKCKASPVSIGYKDIQNMVKDAINKAGKYDVSDEYMVYTYQKALSERKNTIDDRIMSLLSGNNEDIQQENANKNPNIVSTMRDYMAGEVSKDISQRYLIPSDIFHAHKEGIIHFHDMDYFAMPIHNCFSGNTKFITDKGIRQFNDFKDGDIVTVKDKDGILRKATVRNYGKQLMNIVTLNSCGNKIKLNVTGNHRWVLKDGTITTELKVGDSLYQTNDSRIEPKTDRDIEMFCIGFAIGDGCDLKKDATTVRLCGDKKKHKEFFIKSGWSEQSNDVMYKRFAFKQNFLNGKTWRFLSDTDKIHLFNGYYAADGAKNSNRLATSDTRLCDFIEECSGLAGYYISSKKEIVHDTNFKENATLIQYHFITSLSSNRAWKVESIEKGRRGVCEAWCVEEPITHTFTLEKGIVTGNCCLINLDDMLQNGTIISGTQIDKPHTFRNACNIASQIVAQVASSQYGGQTITASHLSKFINVARDYFKSEFPTLNDAQIEDLVRKDIRDGVQTLQYQILTLQTTNGQTPFVSVCLYLNEAENEQEKENLALVIEEILKQRMKGVKNENGQYYANPFPKLLYVLEEDNITPDSKYWYLTKLAAECTTKRMVPDYISEKVMKQLKISKKGEPGDCYPCMGCRSFLTPYRDPKTKKPKYYGRFNQGVVTINLPDVALSAKGDLEKFWYILEQRLELCHRALRLRHEHLRGVKSDVAPILWQNGAFARLGKGETIDKLLYNGYSTISLGYSGLYETVKVLIGKSLTDEDGMVLGKKIMQALNDKCRDWKQVEKIDYSVYGTPIENTTEKFAKALLRRFGTIPGITDKNYITNSYHVPVFEKIDAFKKIDIEAELQKLSPGGAISYIETPNMENNVEAVLSVIKYIYDNIMYAELNCKLDWCHCCGGVGQIEMIKNEDGKLIWHCKNCGNENISRMNVVRRICGYLGSANAMSQGRMGDIHDRVYHL